MPVSSRDKLKEHLDQLVKNEILAPVTVPTDWGLSMVVFQREASSLSRLKKPQQCNFLNHVTSLQNHEKIFYSKFSGNKLVQSLKRLTITLFTMTINISIIISILLLSHCNYILVFYNFIVIYLEPTRTCFNELY